MSEGKWTPGPWGASYNGFYWQIDTYYTDVFNNQQVADACASKWIKRGTDILDESEANAKLIAAAPELYEALSSFLDDERFQTAVGGNPIAVDRMIDRARAALAKARGEQS